MQIASILDGFYEVIMARVLAQVPAIKHFDLYWEQYDNPPTDANGNPLLDSFNRPAVFFQWPADIQFDPLAIRRKKATVEFILHLVQDVLQTSDSRTPVAIRLKSHAHTGTINDLVTALEGYNGDQVTDADAYKQFSAISFNGLGPYIPCGPMIAHKLKFRTRLVFDEAKKFYVKLADLTPPVTATDEIQNIVENEVL